MTSVVTIAALGILSTAVSVDAQQAGRRGAPWRDIQGFNIVLIVGENERSDTATLELPAGARRALTDMREFLPYRHYRVLDSQWTSCCAPESIRHGSPMSGRLQGVSEGASLRPTTGGTKRESVLLPRAYVFTLSLLESTDATRLPVKFALRLEEASSGGRGSSQATEATRNRVADMRSDLEILSVQIADLQKRVEVGTAPIDELRVLQARQTQLQRRIAEASDGSSGFGAGHRGIIDTSFTMDVGETVVVGTSRLGGDKALIALVTAVRRTSARR